MKTIDMHEFLEDIHSTLSNCDEIVALLEKTFEEEATDELKETLRITMSLMKLQNKMLRSTYLRLVQVIDTINDLAEQINAAEEETE